MIDACPLCAYRPAEYLGRDTSGAYGRCPACELIFADPAGLPDAHSERTIYDYHQNSPDDSKYRRFLDQLAVPLCECLGDRPQHGLDYGAGPGPTLSVMLAEAGHQMTIYDPFYAPDNAALQRQYDFITCTETAEHFHVPGRDWAHLAALLRPGGWLGVMTELAPPLDEFWSWHYRRDPTHVAFYNPHTMAWIARRHGLMHELVSPRVALFQKTEQQEHEAV